MKMLNRSTKGFTLVEIMIVVVIIGLLAAMAIPAFQKVRRSSIAKALANDARQVGGAVMQIALEYPADCPNAGTFTIQVAADGTLSSTALGNVPADKIREYVRKVGRGTASPITYTFGANPAFSMTHPQCSPSDVISTSSVNTSQLVNTAVQFDEEGKAL